MEESNESKPTSLALTGKGVYLEVARRVRQQIERGRWKHGDWLPASRILAKDYGVHRHTITKALDELVAEGWLLVEPRGGFQVKFDISKRKPIVSKHQWQWARKIDLPPFSPTKQGLRFNFQSGLADLRHFPMDEFRSAIAETTRNAEPNLLDYSNPAGYPSLISAIEEYLKKVRQISDRSIIITNGSQEAIYLMSQLLLRPGDRVAMEKLCYPPARETFRAAGAKVLSIAMDEQGAIPESLDRIARRQKLRLIFLTPSHQFPTTASMSIARKRALYAIAAKYCIPIIEDDYDHEFHYRANPPSPLATNDPAGIVLYVSTFSKLLFPSARIAFMAVPKEIEKEICQFRRIVTHQNDSILQDALARWMQAGGLERHLRKMKQLYQQRRNIMISVLEQIRSTGIELSWQVPQGGMGLWLNLHQASDPIARYALTQGIFVTPESSFQLRNSVGTHLRLGFSNQNETEIESGLNELFQKVLTTFW